MGYTIVANTIGSIASNANFRTWGSFISNLFANCGLVLVANNTDWATATQPAARNTFPSYEVWRFNDALQSTAPVYFKFEYGSSDADGSGQTRPGFALTLATGWDADLSSLTGIQSSRRVNNTWTYEFVNNTLISYGSGGTNRFALLYAANGVGINSYANSQSVLRGGMRVGIERTVDTNGVVTGDGVMVLFGGHIQTDQMVWSPKVGQLTNWEHGSIGFLMPSGTANGTFGSNTAVYPLWFHQGTFFPPGYNFLGYIHPDFTANTVYDLTYYGATHSYMAAGAATHSYAFINARHANACMMIRWE